MNTKLLNYRTKRLLNIYVNIGLKIEHYSVLEYIHILLERYRDHEESIRDQVQRKLQFCQVYSPETNTRATIHAIKWDLKPSDRLPLITGRSRRPRTLAQVYASGVNLRYPDTGPVLFEYHNRKLAYTDNRANFGFGANAAKIDYDQCNVILPEVFFMTGTVDAMNQDEKVVADNDNYMIDSQLEVLTYGFFDRLIKSKMFKEKFEKWFGTVLNRRSLKLIRRNLEAEVTKFPFRLKKWFIFYNEEMSDVGKIKETIAELGENIKQRNSDFSISDPVIQGLSNDEANDAEQWLKKLEPVKGKKGAVASLVIIVQDVLREDIYRAVKSFLIEK